MTTQCAQTPLSLHPGLPVLLAPRRGRGQPSYAMVVRSLSSAVASVVITADSGGRRQGAVLAMPRKLLETRPRGRHRGPRTARAWWRVW